MKKLVALILLVTLLLSMALFLCACSGGSSTVKCPSCGKQVSRLITRKDAAGVSRTWCSDCWRDYDDIMG